MLCTHGLQGLSRRGGTDTNQSSLKWYGARDENLPEVLAIGATDAKALNKAVDKLRKDNDIIIIDGTPSLSEMTTRIILASDLLIIPIRPGAHDFRTMDEFFTRYNQEKEIKENIPAYFLLNAYSERINVHKKVHTGLQMCVNQAMRFGIFNLSGMKKQQVSK